MHKHLVGFTAVAVICGVLSGAAFADATIADDESEGYALVSGTEAFSTTKWAADVDYAVYAPGEYPGEHFDKDTHYIYAYQIFNDSDSDVTLSNFSVGLGENSGADNPGCEWNLGDGNEYGVTGGIEPGFSLLVGMPPTSVQWTVAQWAPDEYSTVLLFSSPYTYTSDSATVVGGGQGDTHDLPSPLPEPAVLILLVGGVVPVLLKRRRKAKA